MPTAIHTRRLAYAILSVGTLVPFWAAYRHQTYLNDDTYITLTYAKNLAHGNGFVFNHAPAVLGTTTPLLALIVAALSAILPFLDVATVAAFVTALCWAGVAWLIFLFRRVWGLDAMQAAVVGTLLILTCTWVRFLGMEAYLFAFLLVLGLSLFYSQRYFLAGLALGLLFLTRGEGVLALVIVVGISLAQQWLKPRAARREGYRPTLALVSGFIVPVVPWFLYAFATFGAVLPNTLLAKRAAAQFALMDNPFLTRLFQEWLPLWPGSLGLGDNPLSNIWWLFVAIGAAAALVSRSRWCVFLAWLVAYTVGYTLVGVTAAWWYQLPMLFVCQLFFALGVMQSAWFLARRLRPQPLAIGIAAALLVCVAAPVTLGAIRSIVQDPGDPRAPSYLSVARWLRENTNAGDSVAVLEIGYLGFYTNNRIIDLAGLVLPDIASHVANGDLAWGFWTYQPDYYVYSPDFDWVLASIRSDPRFAARYHPVAELPGPNGREITVYKSVSAPP